MTGAVPCHEPEANEARSQPTPHRSNQSDNAAPCGYAALGCSASTWRLQIGLNNLPGITSTPATQPLSKRPLIPCPRATVRCPGHHKSAGNDALSRTRGTARAGGDSVGVAERLAFGDRDQDPGLCRQYGGEEGVRLLAIIGTVLQAAVRSLVGQPGLRRIPVGGTFRRRCA